MRTMEGLKAELRDAMSCGDKGRFLATLSEVGDVGDLKRGRYQNTVFEEFQYQWYSKSAPDFLFYLNAFVEYGMSPRDRDLVFIGYVGYGGGCSDAGHEQGGTSYEVLDRFVSLGVTASAVTAATMLFINRCCDDDRGGFLEYLLEIGADTNLKLTGDYLVALKPIHSDDIAGCVGFRTPPSLIGVLLAHGVDPMRLGAPDYVQLNDTGLIDEFDPNAIGRDGRTAVTRHLSQVRRGRLTLKALRSLKNAGADFNRRDRSVSQTTRSDVSAMGDTPLTCLISRLPVFPRRGKTEALAKRVFRLTEYLLQNGADPNTPGVEGSPLVCVIEGLRDRAFQKRMADLLVAHGADVCGGPGAWREERNVLAMACRRHPPLLRYLRRYIDRAPEDIVEAFLFSGHRGVETFLSAVGEKPATAELTMALKFAIRAREAKVAQILIDHGAETSDILSGLDDHNRFSSYLDKGYTMHALKFFSKLDFAGLQTLWEEVLSTDWRPNARRLAVENLARFIGEDEARRIGRATETAQKAEQKAMRAKTNEFVRRLKRLYKSLPVLGFYGCDVDGRGHPPCTDWDLAIDMFLEEAKKPGFPLKGRNPGEAILYYEPGDVCLFYSDVSCSKSEVRASRSGRYRESITDTAVYFVGPDEETILKCARIFIDESPKFGLVCRWDGSATSFIGISMVEGA